MGLPPRLVVASKNLDKVREVRAVLAEVAPGVEVVEEHQWADVAETGETLEENALIKARAVAAATGLPALADDTGLEVDALGGAPGVRTARFSGVEDPEAAAVYAANRRALLTALRGVGQRRARFRTVVALAYPGGGAIVAEGVLPGRIALAERGEAGFGYDPVFEVGERTLAELGEGEKNRISHRARALAALAARLAGGDGGEEQHRG